MTQTASKPRAATQYGVMLDQHGVTYLRVGGSAKGVLCVINTGQIVELIEMDNSTAHSRDLRPLKDASIWETAKQLYKPLSRSVQVSPRAEPYLKEILDNKELREMARVAVATKSRAAEAPETTSAEAPTTRARSKPVLVKGGAAKKAAAAPAKPGKAKAAAAAANGSAAKPGYDDYGIKALVKQNPCREGSFCYAEVDAALASKTVGEAQLRLDKSGLNPTKRRIEVAWLVKKGYIKVIEA